MSKWEKFYKKNYGNNFPNEQLIIFFYRYFIKSKKNRVDILDLGSGTGSTLMLTKKSFYVDLVDISKAALKKIKTKNKNIKTFNQDFNLFLKNSKKNYDLIIDSASLQHQSEDGIKQSFSLINKNLKKNGYFFSININSHKGINDGFYYLTKLKKSKLLNLFKICNLQNVQYNYSLYTENNSKNFIKFNIIFGQKKL